MIAGYDYGNESVVRGGGGGAVAASAVGDHTHLLFLSPEMVASYEY